MGIAAETQSDARYIVCNAGEDEPGSFKDRVLLEYRPHLVLEGVLLAARAISAEHAYLYINETYDRLFRADDGRGRHRRRRPDVSPGITPSRSIVPQTVYVAGEDSVVLEVLEGKPPSRGKNRRIPQRPASSASQRS